MRVNDFAYIAGEDEGYQSPLENFLPPLKKGVFPTWVRRNQLEDHFLIDPFSANPILPVELAVNGFKVLCSQSNPNIKLMTEVMCRENAKQEISDSVNKLLIARQGSVTLEDTLKSLYATPCAGCRKMIQADGFVWEKGSKHPISRVYTCPHCGDSGERKISAHDLQNLNQLGKLDIYQARAKQRVGVKNSYQEESLALALACYLPRSLYVCMLLINRFEMLSLEEDVAKFLRAALLTVFNDAHSLRHWPFREYRFIQLSIPQKFFEKNLFLSLVNSIDKWPTFDQTIDVSYWPELPSENGGICFYQRKLSKNKDLLPEKEKTAITTIIPRPGQAFWTFSAIWAGWLWGKNAVKPLRSAFGRRRYDWFWFAKAVNQSINRIKPSIKDNTKVYGLFPYFSPNLTYGLFTGMHTAGFKLTGAAFRQESYLLQCEWASKEFPIKSKESNMEIESIIQNCLNEVGEPVDFQNILMQVVTQMTFNNLTKVNIETIDETDFSRLNNRIKKFSNIQHFLTLLSSETQSGSKYWLFNDRKSQEPRSERMEAYIFEVLQHANEISKASLCQLVCTKFNGLLTPEAALFHSIVHAYAEEISEGCGVFKLRPKEILANRKKEVNEISSLLLILGERLGYLITDKNGVIWTESSTNSIEYTFHFSITAQISDLVLKPTKHESAQHVLIFPGSRAGLINYRFKTDPRLTGAIENGWHFVKFRHIRQLANMQELTPGSWRNLLDGDPPMQKAPVQLQII